MNNIKVEICDWVRLSLGGEIRCTYYGTACFHCIHQTCPDCGRFLDVLNEDEVRKGRTPVYVCRFCERKVNVQEAVYR